MVIVVRHAEKADATSGVDLGLSAAGKRRAEALAVALAHVGVGTVITSQMKRTLATATPIAQRTGVKPLALHIQRGELAAHIADVRAAVEAASRAQKGAVLVVGHSNTVPLIVRELSGKDIADICDSQFSNFYMLSIPRVPSTGAKQDASAVQLIHVRYGDADPLPVAPDCK